MAVTQKTNPGPEGPFHGLREDTLKSLDAVGIELDKAAKDIEALEAIGLDVSRLKERLEWGRKAREIILSRVNHR